MMKYQIIFTFMFLLTIIFNSVNALTLDNKKKDLSIDEINFKNYINAYCVTIPVLRTERQFKKMMLDSMKETAVNGDILPYWLEPRCEPKYIAMADSPMAHLFAENSTDRLKYLVFLNNFYKKQIDEKTFKRIINAKNTKGQTMLDYIQYVFETKRFVPQEELGINEMVKFICENGGEYSVYKNKSCPAEYMYLYK